jgi:hypothetical protein
MRETRHSTLEQRVRLIKAASAETLNFSSFEAETPSKRFGDSAALTSISFSVREKAIVGVIGPNASGKTILSINHFTAAAQIPTVLFRLSPGTYQSSPPENNKKLPHDLPSPVSGDIGVWSKADSVVYYDNNRVVKNAL